MLSSSKVDWCNDLASWALTISSGSPTNLNKHFSSDSLANTKIDHLQNIKGLLQTKIKNGSESLAPPLCCHAPCHLWQGGEDNSANISDIYVDHNTYITLKKIAISFHYRHLALPVTQNLTDKLMIWRVDWSDPGDLSLNLWPQLLYFCGLSFDHGGQPLTMECSPLTWASQLCLFDLGWLPDLVALSH